MRRVRQSARYVRPEYFTREFSLVPVWPRFDPERALALFALTMGILLAPKLFGLILSLTSGRERRASGGGFRLIVSALFEVILSALLAPILMLKQTAAVTDILLGGCVSWGGQSRDGGSESWRAVLGAYGWPTLIGGLWALLTWLLTPTLLPWLAPVLLGLLLAIPLALLSGRVDLGLAAARRGWFLVPEEIAPPRELAWMDGVVAPAPAAAIGRRLAATG